MAIPRLVETRLVPGCFPRTALPPVGHTKLGRTRNQRQWSDLAILRTTPALLGLFSLVTLWANRIKGEHGVLPNRVRWYPKAEPTFSDALALVRRELWTSPTFATSPHHRESAKNTDRLLNRLINVACNPP